VDIDRFLWCKGYYNQDQDGEKQSEADSITVKDLQKWIRTVKYRCAPHKDVSVNSGPHIWQ